MLLRCLVAVGWMGLASLAINVATAQDAQAPIAVDGINLSDRASAATYGPHFDLNISAGETGRQFSPLNLSRDRRANEGDRRDVELALIARGAGAGLPVDVALSHRASVTVNENGEVAQSGRGSELRLGRGIDMPRRAAPRWDQPAIYLFAAADDEALTWQPGARSAFGGGGANFALQDRVEIGDLQAGITYEAGGLQASLAYVEREVSVHSGSRSFTQDENFAGLTVTLRH